MTAAVRIIRPPVLDMSPRAFRDRLHAALSERGGRRKEIAGAIGSAERTVDLWLSGATSPDAFHLVRLMATDPAVQAEVRRLAGMATDLDPDFDRDLQALVQSYLRLQRPES